MTDKDKRNLPTTEHEMMLDHLINTWFKYNKGPCAPFRARMQSVLDEYNRICKEATKAE